MRRVFFKFFIKPDNYKRSCYRWIYRQLRTYCKLKNILILSFRRKDKLMSLGHFAYVDRFVPHLYLDRFVSHLFLDRFLLHCSWCKSTLINKKQRENLRDLCGQVNKRPIGLNGHLGIRDSNSDVLSEGLIAAYQQAHHRINKYQQWQRKAAL